MPTTLNSFIDAELRMRFREPYVTEGLNQKMAINTPRGVYRGFRLAVDSGGGTNTVEILADPVTFDHHAVYTTTTGFAVSLHRSTGNFVVDLTSMVAGFEKTVVICLKADYAIGTVTTGEVLAYELSPTDEFTIATEFPELVVLGTVIIPAGGAVLVADDINHERRRSAWDARAREAIAWTPIVRNAHFELTRSPPGESVFWEHTVDAGNMDIFPLTGPDDPYAGNYYFVWESAVEAGQGATLLQNVNVPVSEGQLLKVRLWKDNMIAPSAGSFTVKAVLSNAHLTEDTTETLATLDVSGVDGGFVELETMYTIPTGRTEIVSLAIVASGLTYGSAGTALRLGGFQAWLEPPAFSPHYNQQHRNQLGPQAGTTLSLFDQSRQAVGGVLEDAALIEYAKATDKVTVKGRTGTTDPELDVPGNVTAPTVTASASLVASVDASVSEQLTIGSGLLGTDVEADSARIITPASVASGVEYTLIHESVPSGEKGYRLYVTPTGAWVTTVNAAWSNNGNSWSKDVNGEKALRASHTNIGVLYEQQDTSPDAWADGSWTSTIFDVDDTGIKIPAAGNLTATTIEGQLQQLRDGVHGTKTLVLSAGMANGNWSAETKRLGDADSVSSQTSGGTDHMSWTLPLHTGDRITAMTAYGVAGNSAGEELQVRFYEQTFSGGSNQISTTETSSASGTWASVGWTTADTDFTPSGFTLAADKAYYVRARVPQTSSGGELLWVGLEVTYDHPA